MLSGRALPAVGDGLCLFPPLAARRNLERLHPCVRLDATNDHAAGVRQEISAGCRIKPPVHVVVLFCHQVDGFACTAASTRPLAAVPAKPIRYVIDS